MGLWYQTWKGSSEEARSKSCGLDSTLQGIQVENALCRQADRHRQNACKCHERLCTSRRGLFAGLPSARTSAPGSFLGFTLGFWWWRLRILVFDEVGAFGGRLLCLCGCGGCGVGGLVVFWFACQRLTAACLLAVGFSWEPLVVVLVDSRVWKRDSKMMASLWCRWFLSRMQLRRCSGGRSQQG